MGKNAFTQIGDFKAVEFEEANEQFDFGEACNGLYEMEDIFGDPPEVVHVHKGAAKVSGNIDASFSGVDGGVYVVDGDLTVTGTLRFSQQDGGGILLVTGNLESDNLLLDSQAHLWVGGEVKVKNILVADLEDAGDIVVGGSIRAAAILKSTRGTIEVEGDLTGRLVANDKSAFGDDYAEVEEIETAVAPAFKEAGLDQIAKAIFSGKTILAAS